MMLLMWWWLHSSWISVTHEVAASLWPPGLVVDTNATLARMPSAANSFIDGLSWSVAFKALGVLIG